MGQPSPAPSAKQRAPIGKIALLKSLLLQYSGTLPAVPIAPLPPSTNAPGTDHGSDGGHHH